MNQSIRSASSKNKHMVKERAAVIGLTFSKIIPVTVASLKLNPEQKSMTANNITIKHATVPSVTVSGTFYMSFGGKEDIITNKPTIDGTLTASEILSNKNGNFGDYSSMNLYDSKGSMIFYDVRNPFTAVKVTTANMKEVTTTTNLPQVLHDLIHDANNFSSGYLYKLSLATVFTKVPAISASTNDVSYTLNMNYFKGPIIYYNNTSKNITMPLSFRTQLNNYFVIDIQSCILKSKEAILVSYVQPSYMF